MNVIMKSRMRERRTYGSVRGLWREPLVYSTMEYFLNPENGGGYYYDEIGVPTANALAEPKLDEASEILQQYLENEKTVFTYYAYEPAGFDAESWKVTVEYLNSGNKDHKKLIQNFNDAFDKYADALE